MPSKLQSHAVRVTFKIDHPWYLSSFKLADTGKINIHSGHIDLFIGATYYRIEEIHSLRAIPASIKRWSPWIEFQTKLFGEKKVFVCEVHQSNSDLFMALNNFMSRNIS